MESIYNLCQRIEAFNGSERTTLRWSRHSVPTSGHNSSSRVPRCLRVLQCEDGYTRCKPSSGMIFPCHMCSAPLEAGRGCAGCWRKTHPESQWTRRRPVVLLDQALKHATGHKDNGNEHEDDCSFFCTLAMFAKTSRKGDQGNRRRDVSQTISGIWCPLQSQGVV